MSEINRDEPCTVGDVRRAIDGLPDDAPVALCLGLDGVDEMTDVRLKGVMRDGGRLLVRVVACYLDDDEDDYDEDYDDPEDDEDEGEDD